MVGNEMQGILHYNFEWDPQKAKANLKKHKCSFERGASIFLDPRVITIFDNEHSGYEDRWVTLGLDANGVPLVVCHTFEQRKQECSIRLFSARKATKKERKQYKG